MYSYPRRDRRGINLFLALAIVWCVAIWFGLIYLLGVVIG
jgi:hypothetical protein